ncbi:nucleolar and coiled-body phosphoprotein 1 isoform X1 [Trifolium pratense]|uniref:nucleolar and coiled-body phosphoprotein 1 isoform X1 n=1 Tax=Trifolium pratense TaxID=57577 RepID=UPI001E695F99|nr:nucleolar and coiled-body phosphoprotein 1 isoform X1 [Trifolium pratense]
MPANPSGIKGISTLFSFTPRQVLLTMKNTAADNGTLNSEQNQKQKLLLHQSIALYFERSGFSKSLKKFLSEAKIVKDNTEGSSVDLEEMCRKYLETSKDDAKSTINDQKEEVAAVHSKHEEEKSKGKKKKKSNLVSESAVDNQLESPTVVTENKVDLSTVAKVDNGAETEKRSKHKTKKNKSNIEGDATEQIAVTENKVKDDLSIDAKVENGAETEKKSKRKIKKKDKSNSEGDSKEQIGEPDTTVSKKENSKATNEEAMPEKKDSKKRKRTISKENDEQDTEVKEDEETKRRKVENLNESQGGDQSAKTNGHYENGEEKSSVQKSQKKKNKESAEKAVKVPFQRVQVDNIDHEKLLDNSYWAKGGAESGYGAKAEEVLGQVRGRDFRHEKTKKKRGTYRGGHIDLHSHSIKFNYSDEE